jgi:hypothetical protein
MATKDSKGNSTSKPQGKTPRFNDVVFISYPLTKEQTDEIKKAIWDIEDLDHALITLAEQEYKTTTSYDTYSSSYACFITPRGDKHINAGFILTGRGSSPHKAIRQAFYIHAVLFEYNWSGWKDERRNTEIDD